MIDSKVVLYTITTMTTIIIVGTECVVYYNNIYIYIYIMGSFIILLFHNKITHAFVRRVK